LFFDLLNKPYVRSPHMFHLCLAART
jgi:hypothetical protein